jgi:hypothetical protein
MSLQTEYEFTLPRGYLDASGRLHRNGRMRLATALGEIQTLQGPRVQANEAYLPVLLLSRVLTRLGDLPSASPQVVESFFAADLAYLEDLYMRLNCAEPVMMTTICPHCSTSFLVQVAPMDEYERSG